ncbi:MAG: tRNA (N(6)-L-threonylcarbamoyladenosine(37)-C(2))-methylthiotransferase [Candidatus Bathyarchaeota archaeon]|nr:tRNA (N(6)-L-threonylcarbamoyladenosine(37)-C(2))-methylthiotransferase [Candidatus Bathyarchaeota archaeon]
MDIAQPQAAQSDLNQISFSKTCMVRLVPDNISKLRESSESASLESLDKAKNVYVENHGCAANKFDLEIMLAHLANAGYRVTEVPRRADIVLINTCGVKKPTEDRMIERIRKLSRLDKPLIIAGCLPRINFKAVVEAAPGFSAILDPRSIDSTFLAVKSAETGGKNRIFFRREPIAKLSEPKIRLNPHIEIISIAEGCAGACAFCCVRFARGRLSSYPKALIAKRVRQAVSEGVREIWLTSQDSGAYGVDRGTNLSELLKECSGVEGKFLCRVGMMNPDHIAKILPELIGAYKDEKVFKFLHLPVQSGDNETLRRMNRRYTVEEYRRIVCMFRGEIPRITLSTDVICGFPGESREAFERTVQLVEDVEPDIVNISKFLPRPNTPAAKMDQLDPTEVKDRSRKLTGLAKSISLSRNVRWINWEGEILVDERGRDSSWVGRNFAYKPVVVKSGRNLAGKFLRVRVVKAFRTHLEAEVVDHERDQ